MSEGARVRPGRNAIAQCACGPRGGSPTETQGEMGSNVSRVEWLFEAAWRTECATDASMTSAACSKGVYEESVPPGDMRELGSSGMAEVEGAKRLAASARALLMGVRRWDVEGKPYKADIGPARGEDGVERRLPREIWELIFSFLIFDEGYRDAHRANRRRTS